MTLIFTVALTLLNIQYTVPTTILYPTNNIKIIMFNNLSDTHTRSLMKTVDYTIRKPVPWWVINVKQYKNILITFKWQKMPWHTAHIKYFWKPSKEGKPTEGKWGFVHFTVLKDVRETMNVSALPALCCEKGLLAMPSYFGLFLIYSMPTCVF